jgi:hypothetical protein
MKHRYLLQLAIAFSLASTPFQMAYAQSHDEPETVLVTYHAKSGHEAQLLEVLRKDWATVRKLNLVDEQPHVLVQGKDDSGKPIFVEVFTWSNGETPDHVPAEVQAIWTEMGAHVEARDGHPGVDFRAVTPLREK